jgi:hypothetical protein
LGWISTAVSLRRLAWDDGKLKRLGRVVMRLHLLEVFAKRLSKEDVVVIEATGNAASVAAVIALHVKRVVIANPKQVRIIAYAKIICGRPPPARGECGFSDWSGAVICPARLCGAYGRRP